MQDNNDLSVVCAGTSVIDKNSEAMVRFVYAGGSPLRYQKEESKLYNFCDAIDSSFVSNTKEKATRLKEFVLSWQFYADLIIWTAPLLGLATLYTKKHENSRH